MQAAQIMNIVTTVPAARWTAAPMPMLEPDKEGLAYMRLIRLGLQTHSEAMRERGYDPDEMYAELAEDNDKIDALGLRLDSDGRYMTQAGQLQGAGVPTPPEAPSPAHVPASPDPGGDQ